MVHRDFIHVWPVQVDQEELTGKTNVEAGRTDNTEFEEDNVGIESAGPILIDDAVDMMRNTVRGNGLDEKAVFFNAFSGTVLHFETYQVFRIKATTGEKYVPGRAHGVAVGSRQDARNKVMATVENAATNIDVHKTTIKFLKLRNDLGFALNGWAIRYDGMKRNYVVHEKCPTCSGLGKNNCNDCKGTRKRNCSRCSGSKLMTCTNCKGRKQFPVKGGRGKQRYKKCKACTGTGKIRCTQCKGTGSSPCRTCTGSGKIGCKPCTATGWRSHITFMEISAKCVFDYDKSKLPPEVPPLIDHLLERMVLEKHAHIRINEDLERKQELDNLNKPKEYMMRRPDEFAITYDVRLPWGDIGFNWEPRSEPVTGKLFGFQPCLVHMQPFLEEIALPGIRALGEASTTDKHIAAKAARSHAVPHHRRNAAGGDDSRAGAGDRIDLPALSVRHQGGNAHKSRRSGQSVAEIPDAGVARHGAVRGPGGRRRDRRRLLSGPAARAGGGECRQQSRAGRHRSRARTHWRRRSYGLHKIFLAQGAARRGRQASGEEKDGQGRKAEEPRGDRRAARLCRQRRHLCRRPRRCRASGQGFARLAGCAPHRAETIKKS